MSVSKTQLNAAFIGGSLVLAALVATLFPSWLVFGSVMLLLLVIFQQTGRIRFGQ